jgi:hypothetical protein
MYTCYLWTVQRADGPPHGVTVGLLCTRVSQVGNLEAIG